MGTSSYIVIYCTSFLLLTKILAAEEENNGPTVNLPQGRVEGTFQKSYKGRTYSAFEGIPFAKPPVDELRFKEPEPAERWEGTLVADENYKCPFYVDLVDYMDGEEDCLYLYVYVPKNSSITGNEKYDVVVHIHGGGFVLGSPGFIAGPRFIMDKDVVYVSFNYRLGILGFLSTEDNYLPGNNGLKDQVLALKWIKNNIKYFGGNPDSVTITGLSAGAVSVHFHYLSPMSKGLFHRGLSQSGTALQNWGLTKKPRKYALEVAELFGCGTESLILVECLRRIDVEDLLYSVANLSSYIPGIPTIPIGPVVDSYANEPFLPDHPYNLLKSGQVQDLPWITSNAKEEGLFIAMLVKLYKSALEQKTGGNLYGVLNSDKYAINSMELQDVIKPGDEKEVAEKIKKYYFDGDLTEDKLDLIGKLVTERAFLLDANYALRVHSKAVKSPTYYYLFSYVPKMPAFFGKHFNGSTHGDDGRLLFEMLGTPKVLDEEDDMMVNEFTDFMANYAKTGIPTFNGVEWKPLDPNSEMIDFLYIGGPRNVSMQRVANLPVSFEFWENLPIHEYFNNK